jgi:hypothetical protein
MRVGKHFYPCFDGLSEYASNSDTLYSKLSMQESKSRLIIEEKNVSPGPGFEPGSLGDNFFS